MKISRIEFENFRNFKERGVIKCSTDGRVTIIYGKNGDGKTTLHQLFQWILYGDVHFNGTTTDRLYNLQYEDECSYSQRFKVMGSIDFEHDNHYYSVKRIYEYQKNVTESNKINEDFILQKKDEDDNWIKIEQPKEVIEKLLPSGLSEYFFFDGESMIADLRVKGRDSASKLRKALYSMFDLDIIEAAINHIGKTTTKMSALGKLYGSKVVAVSSSKITTAKINFDNAQKKIDDITEDKVEIEKQLKEGQKALEILSEKIGTIKSKREYENARKQKREERDRFLKSAVQTQGMFGDAVIEMFPNRLIGRAVAEAKDKINLKIAQSKLPDGITKKLIAHLLARKTENCVCGKGLDDKAREHIKAYLDLMPPKSYGSLYHEFTRTADRWNTSLNEERLNSYIKSVLDYNSYANKCEDYIEELDKEEASTPDIENLIIERRNVETTLEDLSKKNRELDINLAKYKAYRNKMMRDLDELTKNNVASIAINKKIAILENVVDYFRAKLDNESKSYSEKLQFNIQSLIDDMLTSKRRVSVSPEFSVRVTDHFGDESKSEGQFAVVSFAYIGGILKMLKSEDRLVSKEYPLVLDGPFSKLDIEQRQNVVDIIPQFAPQVILFSKDDLNDVFKEENIGNVWTIVSNEEKNVASVKEGKLWK